MKIAVLTGGGDVPGLNACIKAIVCAATEDDHEVLGIRRGWKGLLWYDPAAGQSFGANCMRLDKAAVRRIDLTGGTILHTSRTNPGMVKPKDVPDFLRSGEPAEKAGEVATGDFTDRILKNLEHLEIETLIAIGGDDTLSYAERLHREGFPVLAIPKTMDNDVSGTDYCIGFSTAVSRSVQFIEQLRSTASSHERIAIIELFGRNSGETALMSAHLAGADRAIICEVPFDPERLATLVMQDKRENPDNYAMIAISEGAQMVGDKVLEYGEPDAYGHRKLGGIGQVTGAALKKLTGQDVIFQPLAYLMRSGVPDSLDLMVGINFGNMAADLIREGESGRMLALRDGNYTDIPLSDVVSGTKRVDVDELYDSTLYQPKVRHLLGKPMFLY